MVWLIGLMMTAVGAAGATDVPSDARVLEPAFTGTILSTYPDGRTSHVWLNRDGTFSSEGRAHERKAGRWYVKRGALCLTQSKPIPIPFLAYCSPIPTTGIATSWKGKADTGEPITIKVLSDR